MYAVTLVTSTKMRNANEFRMKKYKKIKWETAGGVEPLIRIFRTCLRSAHQGSCDFSLPAAKIQTFFYIQRKKKKIAIIGNKKMFRPYPVLPLQGSTFTSECRKYRIGEGRDLWRRVPKHFKRLSYLEGNSTRTTLWWVGTTALIILGSNHPVSVSWPMAPKESYTATKTTLQNYKILSIYKEKTYY